MGVEEPGYPALRGSATTHPIVPAMQIFVRFLAGATCRRPFVNPDDYNRIVPAMKVRKKSAASFQAMRPGILPGRPALQAAE